MPEYAIFLSPIDPSVRRPITVIRDHCRHLDRLDAESRLIAAGPFSDAADGGLVIGRFSTLEEAEEFAQADPFVRGGYSRAEVRPWEWSHPENGHLGVLEPSPGSHPRFLSTLLLRATTRQFSTRPIDSELVRSLLEAALAAPSEFNLQPWRPIVCHEASDRQRLQRCCFDQPQVGASALALVCAVDPLVFHDEAPRAVDQFITRGHYTAEERERGIAFIRSCYENPRDAAIRNGTIFGHQLLLAGVSQGLTGFWLGGFDEAAIRSEFGLPERSVVAGIVGLGWPEAPGRPMPRQPTERLVGWGRWPDST
jgi:nitroreductase/uncharacterized protein YciI